MAFPAQRLTARTITSADALRLARFPAIRREFSDALAQQPVAAEVTPSFVRFRLKDPGRFHPALFAVVRVGGKGTMIVIGTPKAKIKQPAALASFLRRMGWNGGRWTRALSSMERRGLMYQLRKANIIGGSETVAVLVPRQRVERTAGKFMRGSTRANPDDLSRLKQDRERVLRLLNRPRHMSSRVFQQLMAEVARLNRAIRRLEGRPVHVNRNPVAIDMATGKRFRVHDRMSIHPAPHYGALGVQEMLRSSLGAGAVVVRDKVESYRPNSRRNPQLGGQWCSDCGGPLYRAGDSIKCRFCGAKRPARITAMKKPAPKFIMARNPGHNFQLVKVPPHFSTYCFRCNKALWSKVSDIYADLKGPAFKAYYCRECKWLYEKNPLTRKESGQVLRSARRTLQYAGTRGPRGRLLFKGQAYGAAEVVSKHGHRSARDVARRVMARTLRNPRRSTKRNPILATLGIAANPNPKVQNINIPFRDGQKVTTAQIERWIKTLPNGPLRTMYEARFGMGQKQYKRFHLGSVVKTWTWKTVPVGANKRITDVDFVVSEGKEWSAAYQVPPHSKKYTKDTQGRYLHAHGDSGIDIKTIKHPAKPSKLPERFHTADGLFVGVIPKKGSITDWYRH